MPVGLAGSTIKAAINFAAGKMFKTGAISISAAMLAEGVLRTMNLTRLIAAAIGLIAMTLFTASVGLLSAGEGPARVEPGRTPQAAPTPQAIVIPRAAPTPQAAPPARTKIDDRDARADAVPEDDRPLLKFFDLRDRARSVVYAIDRSGSMATRGSLDVAKRELLASLGQLPPDVQFAVVFYNLQAWILRDSQGHRGLMAATAANQKQVQAQIAEVRPDGGTDHLTALRVALALKPEVIFFLTDADLVTDGDVDAILEEMGHAPEQASGAGRDFTAGFQGFVAGFRRPPASRKIRIQVIEFGRGPEMGPRIPLRRLATTTGGSYLYRDVTQFPRSDASR
jgi:von Willebrand factor type A domain